MNCNINLTTYNHGHVWYFRASACRTYFRREHFQLYNWWVMDYPKTGAVLDEEVRITRQLIERTKHYELQH